MGVNSFPVGLKAIFFNMDDARENTTNDSDLKMSRMLESHNNSDLLLMEEVKKNQVAVGGGGQGRRKKNKTKQKKFGGSSSSSSSSSRRYLNASYIEEDKRITQETFLKLIQQMVDIRTGCPLEGKTVDKSLFSSTLAPSFI